jgi:hypothetical protein
MITWCHFQAGANQDAKDAGPGATPGLRRKDFKTKEAYRQAKRAARIADLPTLVKGGRAQRLLKLLNDHQGIAPINSRFADEVSNAMCNALKHARFQYHFAHHNQGNITLLMMAVRTGNAAMVTALLSAGADINAVAEV